MGKDAPYIGTPPSIQSFKQPATLTLSWPARKPAVDFFVGRKKYHHLLHLVTYIVWSSRRSPDMEGLLVMVSWGWVLGPATDKRPRRPDCMAWGVQVFKEKDKREVGNFAGFLHSYFLN